MSRSSKQAKRLIAYVNSQVALGVPAEEINKAIMSRPIAELEAEAEEKAAAAAASAAGATAPSGTPSTPPTLPASPPLGTPPTPPALPTSGTPPTLPALPTSGTPPTLPALPPSGNTTLNSIPSGTPPTLPAPPASPPSGNATLSGTPPTPPALPPSGTPGSSSFNNWYEEIQVSGLSNSTPSVSSRALVVTNYTNSETEIENNGNKSAEEVELLELDNDTNSLTPTVSPTTTSAPEQLPSLPLHDTNLINFNTTASNNENHFENAKDLGYILLHSNANIVGFNNITNSTNFTNSSETHSTTPSEVQILANSTADSYNVIKNTSTNNYSHDFTNSNDLPTNNTESDHDSFTSNNLYELLGYTSSHFNSNIKIFTPLCTALVVYRQFEMNYSLSEVVRKILPRSNVDISTNHTQSESNNITNSTNVTNSSETPSTTSSEIQTPDLGAPNAPQSNNSTLLETCSVNENHNTNYGFCLPEFSKALTVLPTGAIKQGFYKPSQTNTASSLNTPSDYNTNSLFNSFQINTQTQTSNSKAFIHIYDLIKNTQSLKLNNITNSTNFTNSSATPSTTPSKIQILSTNNYSHDFTNSNDLPTNNTESDHDSFTSNNLYELYRLTPLGTALVVYRQFEMNYSLSEEVRKILPRSNVDISTNHTQSESNNITNSTNVTTLSETPSGNTTLSGAPLTPPGSSSIKKWYEEIQVSGLSNSTPSEVPAPTPVLESDHEQLPSLPLNTSDEYDADNTLNIMTFNRLLTKFSTPDQILALIQTKSETYNSTSSVFSKALGVISDTNSKTKIENNGNQSAKEVGLLNLDSDANSLTPTVSLTQYLYSFFSNIGGSFNNLLGFSPSYVNTTEIYTGINYGQSKSTCLDRINYIDDMKKDDLLYAAKCFNSQFNSSQECMIKSFDIQYNHSSPNHELLSCDIYKGLINLGCKWVSKACESIENINSIDTELCYETIDARNDKIPEITGWHIEIKCDDQTACNAGKKQVTQIALCGSIEDNNYTDNIYSSYDE